MNWKDYFYFERRDRNTVILLLLVLIVSGLIYYVTRTDDTLYSPDESEYQKQLDDFLLNLNDKDQSDSVKVKYPIIQKYSQKLKVGEMIELNSADTTQLKKIPGIGSSFANRIVKYRNLLGGYISLSQLREVWGVDQSLYTKIKPYISLKIKVTKVKINQMSAQELRKHPYINYQQAKIITDLRQRKGNITSLSRLSLLDEFTEKDIKRLEYYLSFD